MSRLVTVNDKVHSDRGRALCGELEAGNILFFPQTPFAFPDDDLKFLLSRKQTEASFHKNVAYRPVEDRVSGLDMTSRPEVDRLRAIISRPTPENGNSTTQAIGQSRKRADPLVAASRSFSRTAAPPHRRFGW